MSASVAALMIALWVAVLVLPGLLVGAVAGLRGWLLIAAAPLLTYAIAGLTGPWLSLAGIGTGVAAQATAVLVVAAVAAGLRWQTRRRREPAGSPGSPWTDAAQVAVAACVLAAAVLGAAVVYTGIGRLDVLPQDWDAVFHANGIRYLLETGDGGLDGMSGVNKYADGTALFYPNAYHLVGAVVAKLSGGALPAVLNGNTLLLPGLLALTLAALVRAFRGRAVLAGVTALVSVAPVTLLYASMSRGPLLPFLLGVALVPVLPALLRTFLDDRAPASGLLLALSAAGLVTIHPSLVLFGTLLAAAMLVQRWCTRHWRGRRIREMTADTAVLLAAGVTTAVLAAPQLHGSATRPAAEGPQEWPAEHDVPGAIRALLLFRHDQPLPQLWLTAAVAVGVLLFVRLDGLRWLGATAVPTGVAWVLVASSESDTVIALSQPLWNDPWRFMTLAALPLTVLAAHGIAGVQQLLRDHVIRRWVPPAHRRPAAAGAAAVGIGVFLAGSGMAYAGPNAAAVADGYGPPEVNTSTHEVRAMQVLGQLATEGQWAMNDRFDGTVWTYAISGVRTVAAHYDRIRVASDAQLLQERFRDYAHDAQVRAAVERLNVRWVIVGKSGFIRDLPRAPGLAGHTDLPFLTPVYDNPGAVVYRIDG